MLHVNSDFVDDIEESYIEYLRHRGDEEGVASAAAEAADAAKDRLFKRKASRYLKIGKGQKADEADIDRPLLREKHPDTWR